MSQNIIIIGGPTASGKTALALDIAKRRDVVIINADSQQVYREIPIITAQPNRLEQTQVPHKIYGIISASEYFSVANWLERVSLEIKEAFAQGKAPLIVGGTGMYIKALVDGIAAVPEIDADVRQEVRGICENEGAAAVHNLLAKCDPQMAEKLNIADKQRVLRAYEVYLQTGKSLLHWQKQTASLFPREIFRMFFLLPTRQDVYERANIRFISMLENGAMEEIEVLKAMNIAPNMPAMNALGVPELMAYKNGEIDYEAMLALAQQKTRNYVKRQYTFFKNQLKDAVIIEDGGDFVL